MQDTMCDGFVKHSDLLERSLLCCMDSIMLFVCEKLLWKSDSLLTERDFPIKGS